MFNLSFEGSAARLIRDEKIFSISEISSLIKGNIEKNFSAIKIQGEISGLKVHSSGHIYFSLKDDESLINAICWRGTKINFKLEDGIQIVAFGNVTTYPGRSQYQFIIKEANIAGEGALLKLLNERRQKFAAEGLFNKKNPIPKYPNIIGIVTSKTGAVIQDMRHRLEDRYPFCTVLVWPVNVQGPGSADQISQAIRGFNFMTDRRPDVLIVARGGGSIEDLWSFNEEIVVRSVFYSRIPVISAVGHETDTTLIDYASDLRAPTPTAAIEFATPVLSEIKDNMYDFSSRMNHAMRRLYKESYTRFKSLSNALNSNRMMIINITQRFDDKIERFFNAMKIYFQRETLKIQKQKISKLEQYFLIKKQQYLSRRDLFDRIQSRYLNKFVDKLSVLSSRLEQSSYKKILEKGFCFISDDNGNLIDTTEKFHDSDMNKLSITFKDGSSRIR